MTDLELLQLVRYAFCKIPNQKLGMSEAKDTYSLCTLIELRIAELKGEEK